MGMLSPRDENGRVVRRPEYVPGKSRTKQSFAEACDVNVIVERFEKTNLITHLARGVPRFDDVSEMKDFQSALNIVKAAEEYFSTLPAVVRAKFENNVAQFVDFCSRPDAPEVLKQLGFKAVDEISAFKEGKEEVPPEPTA